MFWRIRVAAATCVLGMGVPALAANWYEIRSGDFHIVGNVDRKQIAEVARGIDLHRTAFANFMQLPEAQPGVPVTIFVLDAGSFRKLASRTREEVGFYYDSEVHPYIAVRGDDWEIASRIVYHELTHLLLHRFRDPKRLPPWLDEGFAEVLSTLRLERGRLKVGLPAEDRWHAMKLYGWMPLKEMLSLTREDKNYRSGSRAQAFYAQTWNLAHFWRFSKHEQAQHLDTYLDSLAAGTSIDAALQRAFGDDGAALEKALTEYSNKTRFTHWEYSFDTIAAPAEYQCRAASLSSSSAVDELSGWVASRNEEMPGAIDYLRSLAKPDVSTAVLTAEALLAGRKSSHNQQISVAQAKCQQEEQWSVVAHRLCGELLAARIVADNLEGPALTTMRRAAFRNFRQASASESNDVQSLLGAARLLESLEEDAELLARDLKAVFDRAPTMSVAAYALGALYSRTDPEAAAAIIEQGMRHDFNPARVVAMRSNLGELIRGAVAVAPRTEAEYSAQCGNPITQSLRKTDNIQWPAPDPENPFVQPIYPFSSARAGESGTVMLQVYVTEEGRMAKARILTSSGFPRLDNAALDVAQTWRVKPGRIDGKSVCMWVSIPVIFNAPNKN